MTAKHFRALAESLRFARPQWGEKRPARTHTAAQWQADVRAIADVCAAQNGRFDRGRFERACGIDA